MASSSTSVSEASSSSSPSWKYDVFLSFRGEDTRKNFTDHLLNELQRFGINTFIDDQLSRGEQISPALLQAIEESRFSIIIFSQNYASSSWCLDELSKILECVDKGQHTAFPVFCEVDPSHVRHQRGSYAEAFQKHEEAYKNNMEKVVKWRNALITASEYCGWDTRDRHQSKIIKEIVSKIFNKVLVYPSSSNNIGIDSRIEAVLSLLCIGSHDVRMVGIWGMAGIGKTTIAKAIYQRINTQFEGCCFLSNVRENSQRIENLQMELLSKILGQGNLGTKIFKIGSDSIRKALHSKKVLIILDDVNHIKQLEELARHRDWFGPESRIIITTRDKRLLIEKEVDATYEVEELERDYALTLFHQHAFKRKPHKEDFKELCHRTLDYTKGNPLAIKILGCFLYKRTKKEWECELDKLKKIPNKDVQEVLRISFDGLEDTVKDIFLDIACFFKGKDKDYVSELLNSCDFYPAIGISTLIEKALITISDDNRLCIHDLIQEMGWEIVRQQSIEFPGKRSRLWLNEDVKDVLMTNTGTETIEGIFLDLITSEELLDFNVDVFTKMIKLRLLKFCFMHRKPYYFEGKMHLTGDFKFISKNLRYFCWEGYPLKSLPSNFNPRKLFELDMRFSRLEQLWEGNKAFPCLTYMDLSHSRELIKIPDLSRAPMLKKINLGGCTSLVEVHPSIESLEKLSFLNLRNCSKLEEVAKSFHKLTSLERVDFFGCSKLRKLPDELRMSSQDLDLSCCSKLEELPKSIGELRSLKTLNLNDCSELKRLPDNIGDIGASLVTLNLSGCSKLEELPKSIGELRSLKTLNLTSCKNLEELPECIGELTFLKTLDLNDCSELKRLSDNIGDIGTSLVALDLSGCLKLEELPNNMSELTSLKTLNLSYCSKLKKLPNDIGRLQCLDKLVIDGSGIQEVPPSISLLTRLKELSLEGLECTSIKNLALSLSSSLPRQGLQLPSFLGFGLLERLNLGDCNLQEGALPSDMSSLCSLESLDLSRNSFISLPSLTPLIRLSRLSLVGCKSLQSLTELPSSISRVLAKNCDSLETFSHPPNSYAMLKSSVLNFDFSNCGRLLEKEEGISLEAILLGIRVVPPTCLYRSFCALVAGSRIPEWFIHHSLGNSIIVKLPPDFHDLDSVGLAFCVVLDGKFSFLQLRSDHVWFGYHSAEEISYRTSSKRVTHLRFSFDGYHRKVLLFVKECAIRLLHVPMRSEENWNRLRNGEIITERETVNATIFAPPPMFDEERCWETTINVECMAQVRMWALRIEVAGCNIYVPEHVMETSLSQDTNQSEDLRKPEKRQRRS